MVRRRLPAPVASLATPRGTLIGSLDGQFEVARKVAAFKDTDVRQRKFLIAVLISIFINGCLDASTSSQSHAATAEESHHKRRNPQPHRGGSGAVQRFASTSLRRLSRRMPERERQAIRTWATAGNF